MVTGVGAAVGASEQDPSRSCRSKSLVVNPLRHELDRRSQPQRSSQYNAHTICPHGSVVVVTVIVVVVIVTVVLLEGRCVGVPVG